MAFSQHPLVAKLVTDPGATPRVTVLSGYVGNAGRPNHVRIYTSPALDAYVELPEESVRHVAREGGHAVGPQGHSLGRPPHAVLTSGPAAPAAPDAASFLAGDIAARHLTASRAEAAPFSSRRRRPS